MYNTEYRSRKEKGSYDKSISICEVDVCTNIQSLTMQ